MEVIDADAFVEGLVVTASESIAAKYLVLATRARLTLANSHFRGNDVGQSTPNQAGGAMITVSDTWIDVRNSTFSNNQGGGIWFHDQGRGTVLYSSFAQNTDYGVIAANGSGSPIVVANNLFTEKP